MLAVGQLEPQLFLSGQKKVYIPKVYIKVYQAAQMQNIRILQARYNGVRGVK